MLFQNRIHDGMTYIKSPGHYYATYQGFCRIQLTTCKMSWGVKWYWIQSMNDKQEMHVSKNRAGVAENTVLLHAQSWIQAPAPPMLVGTSVSTWGQDSAAMLAIKRSAGVTPQVNLRNSMQARKHASESSTLALKSRTDTTSPKQGYQQPYKLTYVL